VINGIVNNDGTVTCESDYMGLICDEKKCEDNCNRNGDCVNGTCYCYKGWSGKTC